MNTGLKFKCLPLKALNCKSSTNLDFQFTVAFQLRADLFFSEYRDCFNLYDTEHRGQIASSDLIKAMRSLGACPTPGEVSKYLKSIKKSEIVILLCYDVMFQNQAIFCILKKGNA